MEGVQGSPWREVSPAQHYPRLAEIYPEKVQKYSRKYPIAPERVSPFDSTTARETRLEDTFIANSDWTFIDQELARMELSGGFRIADECRHTAGREPATPFRRKLESLIPDATDPIVVDFDGAR
jgi:hypothetical protein